MKKYITIAEIAAEAGVAKSTVSFVINDKNQIPMKKETREKVLRVIKKYGFQANGAARALSTKCTGHIGFILSDTVADGWSNLFYSSCLSGAEATCRERGYGMNISLYNLSSIETFVFPASVKQRSIDGVILCDYVEAGVVKKFIELNIPCVCIGSNLENGDSIPTVASDIVDGALQAVKYAVSIGHRQIGFHFPFRRPDREAANAILRQAKHDPDLASSKISILYTPDHAGDYSAAAPLMKRWLEYPEAKKPSVIISTNQTTLALLKEMRKCGLNCPQDISLISSSDSNLFEMTNPTITSISYDLTGLGRSAANLLIDRIEHHKRLDSVISNNDFKGKLIIRESCSPRQRKARITL